MLAIILNAIWMIWMMRTKSGWVNFVISGKISSLGFKYGTKDGQT